MPIGIHNTEQLRYFLRLNATATHEASHDLGPLLDRLIGDAGAEGVVVYRFDCGSNEFAAIAAQSSAAPRIPELGVTLGIQASAWLRKSREPLQVSLLTDPRFSNLPEGLQYGFQRLLLLPLRAGDNLLGFVTVGRQGTEPFDHGQLHIAARLARIVGIVLERDALHVQMKERKLVERAKGILQQKRRLSEESAYIFLRESSRRLRLPIADIAREVIQSSAAGRLNGREALAGTG